MQQCENKASQPRTVVDTRGNCLEAVDILHSCAAVVPVIAFLADLGKDKRAVGLQQPLVDTDAVRGQHRPLGVRLGRLVAADHRLGQGAEEVDLRRVVVAPCLSLQAFGLVQKVVAQAAVRPAGTCPLSSDRRLPAPRTSD